MEIYNGTYCVYIHTNKINGKMYVGQTVYGNNPRKRWKNGKGYKGSDYFYHAIQKYGWDNFEHEVVANNLTADEANNFETLLIAKLDLMNADKGYNLQSGGTNNMTISEMTRKKISESRIGIYAGENNPMYGITPVERMDSDTYRLWKEKLINFTTSDEFREQTRERNLGKKYSNEVNKKKGRKGSDHPMYGKHHSEETKEKLRKANIGKKDSKETIQKKKDAMTGDTLEKMKRNQPSRTPIMYVETGQVFNSISDASKKLGIARTVIRKCLNNAYKYNVQNYHFVEIDKGDELNDVNSASF